MKVGYIAPIALALCGSMSACTKVSPVSQNDGKITVAGTGEDVERFVALQFSLRPTIAVSKINVLPDGRSTVAVMIPASFTGNDLIHMTREALSADLSYKLEVRRTASSSRS